VYVHSDGQRLGLSKRLNEGARLARAPFLIRMDADDMMHPLRIESQLAVLRDCGDNTVLGSACYSIDGESQPIGYRPAPMGHRTGFAARHSFSHPTVAARTDWFRRNPYSENPVYSRSEDAELWCRTAALSNFQQITRPLQFYREVGVFSLPNYLATGRGLLHLAGEIEQRHLQRTWLQTKECSKMTIAAVLHLVHATNLLIYRHFRPLTASEQADAAAALHRISQVALPLG